MSEKEPAVASTRRHRQECRTCAHLVTEMKLEKVIAHCGKGRWDVMNRTGAPQWFSMGTVRRNRVPVHYLSRSCRLYQRREGI
ncbi:MAG: hypothetical protein Q8O40_16515 [Chloroflexota bacterium]|nr:hypothetical protein [Chloroflexota bacterium]